MTRLARSTERRHGLLRRSDRGAALVLFAISLTALVALAGLCIDGGRAYGARRQMQNAADASAMAATRALDLYQTGQSTDPSSIWNAAQSEASSDGADVTGSNLTCRLLDYNRNDLADCPISSGGSVPSSAAAVRVTTKSTENTFFMQVVGARTYTATGSAAAVIGKPTGGNAPFLMCANAPGNIPPIVTNPSNANPPVWVVNTQAIGKTYDLYGNAIKNNGKDCGDPSSSFRGLIDNASGPFSVPGWWATLTGNHTGPTKAMINNGSACNGDFSTFDVGCKIVVPLCTKGNNTSGSGFQAYCVDLGMFVITENDNHSVEGTFQGRVTLSSGAIGGPADPNGARIVQLAE